MADSLSTQRSAGQRPTTAAISLWAVGALMLTACGDGAQEAESEASPEQATVSPDESDQSDETEATEDAETAEETDEESEEDSGDEDEDSGDEEDSSQQSEDPAAGPVDDADLPGEDTATFFGDQGEAAHVFGVEDDDVLHIRGLPDPEADSLDSAAPDSEVTLTGRERSVDSGIWTEVETEAGVGWVNTAYLTFLTDEQDRSADFADVPPADDARTLAEGVAQRSAGDGEEVEHLEHTVTRAGDEDGAGLWVVDIDGFRGDSVRGERLEITLEQAEDGYDVVSVASRSACHRGVSDEGLCL